MPLLEWKDDYSVGVEELDDQHKKMFGLINGLHDNMQTKIMDKNDLEKLLSELAAYGNNHLTTEEKYFTLYGYPLKEEHEKAHGFYREKIKNFLAGESNHFASFEIIDFLEDWWLGHIITMDKAYEPFFKEKIKS
ncbi:MAG: bacteriohemerythrin [Candidatus Falkowbacteria bacterium]